MDVIAYWIYALLQATVVVVLLGSNAKVLRTLQILFCTMFAPLVTAALAFIGTGKVLDWLQKGARQ